MRRARAPTTSTAGNTERCVLTGFISFSILARPEEERKNPEMVHSATTTRKFVNRYCGQGTRNRVRDEPPHVPAQDEKGTQIHLQM